MRLVKLKLREVLETNGNRTRRVFVRCSLANRMRMYENFHFCRLEFSSREASLTLEFPAAVIANRANDANGCKSVRGTREYVHETKFRFSNTDVGDNSNRSRANRAEDSSHSRSDIRDD